LLDTCPFIIYTHFPLNVRFLCLIFVYCCFSSEEAEGLKEHAVDDPEEVVSMVEMWVSLYTFSEHSVFCLFPKKILLTAFTAKKVLVNGG
jgi:hypothetical protein